MEDGVVGVNNTTGFAGLKCGCRCSGSGGEGFEGGVVPVLVGRENGGLGVA